MALRQAQEIPVGGEHRELVADAQLGQERIDGPDLQAPPAAGVPQMGGVDVIPPIGDQERKVAEAFDDPISGSGAAEPLEQLLEDEPRGEDRLSGFQRPREFRHLRSRIRYVASQGERPDAGIDEEAQSRDLSDL